MSKSLADKVADNKARIIFDNEMKLFDEVIKQLADLDPVEEVQDVYNYKHYKLPTGQHVYVSGQHYVLTNQEISISNKSGQRIYGEIFSNDYEKTHALTSPNISLFKGQGLSDVIEYRLGKNERDKEGEHDLDGYPLKGGFTVSRTIEEIKGEERTYSYARSWGFMPDYPDRLYDIDRDEEQDTIIETIESVPERIEDNSYYDGTRREHVTQLVEEFQNLVQPFERGEIEHESEENIEQRELIVRAAKLEKENAQIKQETGEKEKGVEELKQENEELQQQNAELTKEKSQLQQENAGLKKENLSLKERFLRVRKFITERCARIPFIGKRILREMQQELGEKELPDGDER